jgi:aminomethyltransferase
MANKTPLHAQHIAAGGKLVDYAGWEMPLHYGSQMEEHRKVRSHCGVFDVSHMGVVDIAGEQAKEYLRRVLANDVARLAPGKALYSCLLNEAGGILDDLICYLRRDGSYRLIVNAGTREQDIAWLTQQAAGWQVSIALRPELAIIAVQGPQASSTAAAALPRPLREAALLLAPFQAAEAEGWMVGRTGYTGEDGFELVLPASEAAEAWQGLLAAGAAPCGLGARDSLRLEAGLNLYGQDMDEQTTPLESNLAWTVAWQPPERDFIGRAALAAQQDAGVARRLVGLVLEERGVLRAHQPVFVGGGVGEITSGTFSPVLGVSIALARIPVGQGRHCEVEIRGKRLPARIVKPPFVRHGKALV